MGLDGGEVTRFMCALNPMRVRDGKVVDGRGEKCMRGEYQPAGQISDVGECRVARCSCKRGFLETTLCVPRMLGNAAVRDFPVRAEASNARQREILWD